MGFLSGLSGLLGGESQQTSAPSSVWEPQQPFLQDIYQRAQQASYGGTGQNYAQGFMPGAQRGFDQLMNQNNLQGIASGQTQNENLGGAIQSGLGQINRNFNRNIMPGINQNAAMTNTTGGSRQGVAQGLAMSDANQQATDFVQNMLSSNYQSGIQNQIGAQGAMNQGVQAGLGAAPQLSNLGFGAQYGDLGYLSNLIGSPTVLGGGSSGSSTGGVGGSLGGLADMGALGYVMSDRRLKENIKPVGEHKGFPLYSYNYKGDSTPQVGVIAQDVEVSKPEAVKEINGYKAVNYGEL